MYYRKLDAVKESLYCKLTYKLMMLSHIYSIYKLFTVYTHTYIQTLECTS